MNQGSTHFLRATVIAIGLFVVALCVLVILAVYYVEPSSDHSDLPVIAHLKYPVIVAPFITVIPFFMALYQTLKLLGYIDKNTAFSQASVKALRTIKRCALIMSGVYAANLPLVVYIAYRDDAPGLVIGGLFLALAPLVIAVFAAVLQRLLQSAIHIKSENDLTV